MEEGGTFGAASANDACINLAESRQKSTKLRTKEEGDMLRVQGSLEGNQLPSHRRGGVSAARGGDCNFNTPPPLPGTPPLRGVGSQSPSGLQIGEWCLYLSSILLNFVDFCRDSAKLMPASLALAAPKVPPSSFLLPRQRSFSLLPRKTGVRRNNVQPLKQKL